MARDNKLTFYEAWLLEVNELFEDASRALLFHQSQKELEVLWGAGRTMEEDPQLAARAMAFSKLGESIIRFAQAVFASARTGDLGPGFVLARTLVEQAITFTYLSIAPDEELKKWSQHGYQKFYRLLNRSKNVGALGIKVMRVGVPTPEEIPMMKGALEAFTGDRGGEKTRWTSVSLDDRLVAISKVPKLETPANLLLTALVLCYEIGAEVQHATAIAAQPRLIEDYLGGEEASKGLLMLASVVCVTAAAAAAAVRLGDDQLLNRIREMYLMNLKESAAMSFPSGRSSFPEEKGRSTAGEILLEPPAGGLPPAPP